MLILLVYVFFILAIACCNYSIIYKRNYPARQLKKDLKSGQAKHVELFHWNGKIVAVIAYKINNIWVAPFTDGTCYKQQDHKFLVKLNDDGSTVPYTGEKLDFVKCWLPVDDDEKILMLLKNEDYIRNHFKNIDNSWLHESFRKRYGR
jgi:hypothetical protein